MIYRCDVSLALSSQLDNNFCITTSFAGIWKYNSIYMKG